MEQVDVYKTIAGILASKTYTVQEMEPLSVAMTYLHGAIAALEKKKEEEKKEELVPEESPSDEGIRA